MSEVEVGGNTFVRSVAFAVRSQACLRSTSGPIRMCDPTSAGFATLPSKPKVGSSNYGGGNCKTYSGSRRRILYI